MIPNQDVVDAIESGITHVTRRVELYESDGVTPFYPNGSTEDIYRLIGGGITIDSSRAERRALDLTLDNIDNKLRPNPDGGFWYDKIIKPYRGVRYASRNYKPRILIIESPSQNAANILKGVFSSLGHNRVDIDLTATTLSALSGYAIIVADGGAGAITKSALLQQAWAAGFDIFTKGLGNGVGELPWATTEFAFTNVAPLSITPRPFDTPLAGGWSAEDEGSVNGIGITGIDADAQGIATSLNDSSTHFTASLKGNGSARWFDYKPNVIGTQAKALFAKAFDWLWDYMPYREWETPLGMFQIDNMKTQSFPNQLSLSARDFTKKCLGSKLESNMSFDMNTKVNDLLVALAANAGITRIKLDANSSDIIGTKIDAPRGTERWTLMTDAANFIKHDIYFDLDGFLTSSPWPDPTLGSPLASFKTGAQGNLASFDRSTNDSRIYNHIIVTGTQASDDPFSLGYYGEAINDNPSSPTRRGRIGDRTYFYTSSFFTSDAQCQAHAQALMGQTAFEQYELNLASFVYPWVDAGIVIDFQEPDNIIIDPIRFVASTMTMPLDLSLMTASAKRILFIESEDSSS